MQLDPSPRRRRQTLPSGTLLDGQFAIEAELGRGQTGTVYRARQLAVGRTVALKVLHHHLLQDPDAVARFEREAKLVARLDHPGIVTMYHLGRTDDGRPYLVMELVKGETLEAALEDGPLSPRRALVIARQIAGALATAHAAGIVHRDLKPANVLLSHYDHERDRTKLLDFGVAKLLERDGAGGTHGGAGGTHGAIVGTPHYMAPEQAGGDAVDGRADLYSLGVTLYQMLVGRVPFEGSALAVLTSHLTAAPPSVLDALVGECTVSVEALDALIGRCLAKEPAARFPSAAALIVAIDAALQARPRGSAPRAVARGTVAVAGLEATALDLGRLDTAPVERAGEATPIRGDASTVLAWGAVAGEGVTAMRAAAAPAVRVASRRRPGLHRLALIALAGILLWGGAELQRRANRISHGITASPAGASATADAPRGELQSVVIAHEGYAIRVVLPREIPLDSETSIFFEVWDPDGEPSRAAEIVLTIEDPSGGARALVARAAEAPGRYVVTNRFARSGAHMIALFPTPHDDAVRVFVEVSSTPVS